MPTVPPSPQTGQYDLYPAYPTGPGKIALNLETLAERLSAYGSVTLDGYVGVFWEDLRDRLAEAFARQGVRVTWHDISVALRSEPEIDQLIAPFLGGDDPIFGKRFSGELRDLFERIGGALSYMSICPKTNFSSVRVQGVYATWVRRHPRHPSPLTSDFTSWIGWPLTNTKQFFCRV